MSEKVVVIGGTAAGLSAASKAKRLKPDLDIKVFVKSVTSAMEPAVFLTM